MRVWEGKGTERTCECAEAGFAAYTTVCLGLNPLQ